MESQIIRQSVGIDVAKDDFKVCYSYVDTKMDQRIIAESSFDNSPEGIALLSCWLDEKVVCMDNLYVTMEATGVYHEALCYFLYEQGFKVSVMPIGCMPTACK